MITHHIGRLFTEKHAHAIYGMCRWLGVRQALEIGAFHGFVSVHIATAIKENGGGLLTIIDDFSLENDLATLHNNLRLNGVADQVEIIADKSINVQKVKPIEFAFIDGDHSLDGCINDCNLAIAAGARCIAIHDTVGWWGPRGYVEMIREHPDLWDVIEANHDSGLAILMRRDPKPEVQYSEEAYPEGHAFSTK